MDDVNNLGDAIFTFGTSVIEESVSMCNNADANYNNLSWGATLWLYNQLENNVASAYYQDVMRYYLKLSGHYIKNFEEKNEDVVTW